MPDCRESTGIHAPTESGLRFGTVTTTKDIPPGTPVTICWKDDGVRLTVGHVREIVDGTRFMLASVDLEWCQFIDLERWDVHAIIGSLTAIA
jgi:hypothetical protein